MAQGGEHAGTGDRQVWPALRSLAVRMNRETGLCWRAVSPGPRDRNDPLRGLVGRGSQAQLEGGHRGAERVPICGHRSTLLER